MVNDLRELMHDASSHPPQDPGDVGALLGAGRRRVRVRRAGIVGGTALAAGAITLASMSWFNPAPADLAAAGVPQVAGPSVRLTEARPAVEGQDYRELASYTNEDLESDNGEYFEGVTDDGLVLLRAGQTMNRDERFALLDPASGEKQWLPASPGNGEQSWAVELGTEQLVLMRAVADDGDGAGRVRPELDVLDRAGGTWRTMSWPTLPGQDDLPLVRIGPDGRVYLAVMVDPGDVPEGGWPMGPDGEADDADAEGDVRALWSMSLTDPADVRDEGLRVGSFDFTDDSLVWTDSENGAAGRVHVRDLASGEETSFDPELGERCNLLGFDADGDRIALSQYCGTYDSGVRDDRVQVVTTGGDPVVTVQDSGVEGGQLVAGGDYLTLTAYDRATGGTYLYDFEEGRLLRLSEGLSPWDVASGPTTGDQFLWAEPAGGKVAGFGRRGATALLGEIIR
jgi:hypothetical protein